MDDLARQIGKRLKEARQEAQLTQEEAGNALGIGRAGYANIETGRSLLTIDHLIKLPNIFHKPVAFFLGLDGNLTEDEAELIELYRKLPREYKLANLETFRSLVSRLGKK